MRDNDIEWLAGFTSAAVDACKVEPGCKAKGNVLNELPFTVVRPGGRECYPAIWVQDFTMIFSSGFLTRQEGEQHLRLFLACQNSDSPRQMDSGGHVPAHAVPDHILFNGAPVFFPGTYSSGLDQGGEPWGVCPPYNNNYDVIWLAHMLATVDRGWNFLHHEIAGVTVYDRLCNAYKVPLCESETGIVYTTAEERAVGFIFCDSVYMTGSLLMASLLRVRASRHMADLASLLGLDADREYYIQQAQLTSEHIASTFACNASTGGWLQASTGISSQPDVWGTLYAIYLDVLPPDVKHDAMEAIMSALRNGTIEYEGALRHVPTDRDASPQSAWERTVSSHNRYQNGAYWHMPTGWLVSVLKDSYPDQAHAITSRFLEHMCQNAFTKGEMFGAPWECIGRDATAEQNPVFAPSVTVPFATITGRGYAR